MLATKDRDLILLGNHLLIVLKRPEQLLAEMTDEQRNALILQGHELTQYIGSATSNNDYRIFEEMEEDRILLDDSSRAVVSSKNQFSVKTKDTE